MCTRTCRTCGLTKDLEDFPYQPKHGFRGTSGCYRLDCKDCTAAKARAYRTSYVQKSTLRKGVNKLMYSACSMRVADAKTRAGSKYPFSIDKDFMYDLLLKQSCKCVISGIELSLEKGTPHVLSIDKVNPDLGYTKDNVQWVSWAVNRAKGDLTMQQFLNMCNAVIRCNDYPEMEYTQAGGSALPSNEG